MRKVDELLGEYLVANLNSVALGSASREKTFTFCNIQYPCTPFHLTNAEKIFINKYLDCLNIKDSAKEVFKIYPPKRSEEECITNIFLKNISVHAYIYYYMLQSLKNTIKTKYLLLNKAKKSINSNVFNLFDDNLNLQMNEARKIGDCISSLSLTKDSNNNLRSISINTTKNTAFNTLLKLLDSKESDNNMQDVIINFVNSSVDKENNVFRNDLQNELSSFREKTDSVLDLQKVVDYNIGTLKDSDKLDRRSKITILDNINFTDKYVEYGKYLVKSMDKSYGNVAELLKKLDFTFI